MLIQLCRDHPHATDPGLAELFQRRCGRPVSTATVNGYRQAAWGDVPRPRNKPGPLPKRERDAANYLPTPEEIAAAKAQLNAEDIAAKLASPCDGPSVNGNPRRGKYHKARGGPE